MPTVPTDPAPERERFVEDLLEYMTLEEKAGQLALTPHPVDDPAFLDQLRRGLVGGVIASLPAGEVQMIQRIATEETRLGIPLFIARDTTQGLRTRIPPPVSVACSWDLEAIEAAERLIGEEAAALGINWALAPTLATAPFLCEAGFAQSSGESVWFASHIAAARIRGLQASDETGRVQVLACLQLGLQLGLQSDPRDRRNPGDHDPDARSRRLRGIAGIIEQARPAGVAPETVLRIVDAGTADTSEATAMLKRPGGYAGMLLSDWASLAERAGQLPSSPGFVSLSVERLVAAVQGRAIAKAELDDAVRRVLAAKYDLGLFRSSFAPARASTAAPRSVRDPALDLARKSIVLLRNDPALLPLTIDSGEVLIVGSAARDRGLPMDGGDGQAASVIDGLEELGIACKFVPGLALRHEGARVDRMIDADRMAIGMAGEAARRSRTVICVLGEVLAAPGAPLPEAVATLLETLRAANPRLVVITLGSHPIDPDIGGEPLPCILHAGLLGTYSGQAIAEILSGDHDPGGRLPYAIRTSGGTERLPFGHGLSYADFALTDFAVELGADRVLASAVFTNLGEREGSEVAQLFVRRIDPNQPLAKPVLHGFRRVSLRPGGRESVTFELGAEEIGVSGAGGRRAVEAGSYEVRLGFNARRTQTGEIYVPQGVAEAMTSNRPQSAIAAPSPGLRRA
ncbi:MAG: glycoside hydrolase family 3 C-terminal domain-containing protein [Erythrobacter sp.]|jgi:beta-glucosidase